MESGGYATTRGIRFQCLWAVRQLLQVLAEELISVQIEPAGVEGEGVDLIVELPNGQREYQQCKRSDRQRGKWTIGALVAKGVPATIATQLRGQRGNRFRLVSLDPAPDLRDLADAARDSLDPQSFFRNQIEASQRRLEAFRRFCTATDLDPANPNDLAEARDLLSRTYTTVVGDDEPSSPDLRSQVGYWVDADAGAVVASLEAWAQTALNRRLAHADIQEHLRSQGFELRDLARDPRIRPAVEQLQEMFEGSLAHQMIGGELLPRDEAGQILDLIEDAHGPRFIAAHGPAGVGKSGMLLDLTRRLEEQGLPYLPLRLDRQRPEGTPRQFGARHGLPESPAHCLKALAGDRRAVLILDQLDALHWTGDNAAHALDVCRQLVKEALRSSSLRVVACCRTFDLENDPQIKTWIEANQARKVPVHQLSDEVVRKVVAATRVDPDTLTSRQLHLLKTVQNLRVWEQTVRSTGGRVDFGNERQLLTAFWRSREGEAEKMGVASVDLARGVEDLVNYMDRQGRLSAPERLFHSRRRVLDSLRSLDVLVLSDNQLTFTHQSYLDYHLANILLRRVDEGKTTVVGWVIGSDQDLFRRDQLRLILGMLRDEDFEQYITTLRKVLESAEVRFHLKQLTLQFMGQVDDPKSAEVQFFLSLLGDRVWREHAVAEILLGHPPWFLAADDEGYLRVWLEGEDADSDLALRVIRSVIDDCGERCHRLLFSVLDRGADWPSRIANVLHRRPARDSPSLFDLRVHLAEKNLGWRYLNWKHMGGPNLSRLVRLLTTILGKLGNADSAADNDDGILHGLAEVELRANSGEEMLSTWHELVPRANEILDLDGSIRDLGPLVENRGWRMQFRELLRSLTRELTQRDPRRMMDTVDKEHNPLAELLLLESLSLIETREDADQALQWLMAHPRRLRLRWYRSDLPWEVSRRPVEHLTTRCSEERYASFERFILQLKEPRFRRAMERRHQNLRAPAENARPFSERALASPSPAGETAYHLLPYLPEDRISDAGRRRLAEVRRKFSGTAELYFTGTGRAYGGWVSSPLPNDRLNELSDATWLEIIQNNTTRRRDRRRIRSIDGDKIEESNPSTFASALNTATSKEPGRFARLALRLPADVNPAYLHAIVRGVRAGAGADTPQEDVAVQELEALLALPQVRHAEPVARDVAWLIESRAELGWSSSTLVLLQTIAIHHPDPEHGQLNVVRRDSEEGSAENLEMNAPNCTRGAAAIAIARLLWADPARLPNFTETIEQIVTDPHPAVRVAAFRCCLATLDHDADSAISWAITAAAGPDQLLACSSFHRFLVYSSQRYPERMKPTLLRMLDSSREDVLKAGAGHTVAVYFVTGLMAEEARECLKGDVARRSGAAQVAAALADHPEHHHKAQTLLLDLVDDPEDDVLNACAGALRRGDLEFFAKTPHFLKAFASSRAFKRQPTPLLHRLSNFVGPLEPFADCILTICHSLAARRTENPDHSHWDIEHFLPPILLRLYEQVPNGSETRKQCLDAWDLLLKTRTVSAIALTKDWEAG